MSNSTFVRLILCLGLMAMLAGCSAASNEARLKERADRDFESGKYDRAKVEYLNLLRADAGNAVAIRQLGIIWFEQGAPLQAIPFLLKARELEPENLDARVKLARALQGLGQMAEARKEALEILRQKPGQEDALLILVDTARSQEEVLATEDEVRKAESSAPVACHLASAMLAARKGEFASAESAMQQALELDPKSAVVHLVMANVLALKNDRAEALKELTIAASLSPLRSAARVKLAEYEAQTGAVEKARGALDEILREAPDYLPAWALLARIALTEKKYDEALGDLDNILKRDPMNYDAHLIQAQVSMGQGDAAKALEGLKRLNEAYPKVPLTKLNLARAELLNRNPSQAIAALNEAVDLKPDYTEASLLLAQLNLRTGDPKAVVAAMRDVLSRRPNLLSARLLLAEAYRATGNLEEAASVLQQQIDVLPESPQAYLLLGLVLRQQRKPDEARKAFEKAEEFAPHNLVALRQLTDLDLQNGDFDGALRRVQSEIEDNPDSAGAHFIKGRIHAAQKEWQLAEEALLKAIELDPNYTSAYDLLVSTYVASDRLAEAVAQLEVLLAKRPENVRALLTAAQIYQQMGERTNALDAYEKALAVTPDSPMALNNVAWLYSDLGDLDKAYELASKARALRPDDGSVADTLGWILYKRGDYQTALTLLQESAGKLPNVPQIQYHLGTVSYMMGKMEMARAALHEAADAPSEFEGKEDARLRLALLEETGESSTELSVDRLEALVKARPEDPIARMRLGEAYERQGEHAKAEDAFEQALKVNPRLTAAATALAKLYAGPLQNKDKSFEFAKKARELAPSDPRVAEVLGSIAYQDRQFAWAYSLLQESARQESADATVLHDFAWAAYSLGKVPEAREAMKRVLESAPDSEQAQHATRFLSMTALVAEDPQGGRAPDAAGLEAAEPQIEKVLKANPDYVPALMTLARTQEQRAQRKDAAASYVAVLQQFPEFAPAQKRLAALYVDDPENRAKAYELAVKARAAMPNDPELARTLGELSYHRGEYAYALQLLLESAARMPLDVRGLYYVGMSHWQLKETPQAQEALQHALSAGLEEPLAGQVKKVLAELQQQ